MRGVLGEMRASTQGFRGTLVQEVTASRTHVLRTDRRTLTRLSLLQEDSGCGTRQLTLFLLIGLPCLCCVYDVGLFGHSVGSSEAKSVKFKEQRNQSVHETGVPDPLPFHVRLLVVTSFPTCEKTSCPGQFFSDASTCGRPEGVDADGKHRKTER